MTEQPIAALTQGQPGSIAVRDRIILVVLSAVFAVLLYLPVLLLGYTFSVLASVVRGEHLAWQSVVAMSYAFLGVPALFSLAALLVPWRVMRTRPSTATPRQAATWVGVLLVTWHVAMALFWTQSGLTRATNGDDGWLALASAVTALAILVATIIAARHGVSRAGIIVGLPVAASVGALLFAVVLADKPAIMPIPTGAQQVRVVMTASAVRVEPASVHAGDVYFVVDAPGEETAVGLVYGATMPDGAMRPLSDEGVARIAAGDYQGTTMDGLGADVSVLMLTEGSYVFLGPGSNGGVPGVAPRSMAVLRVVP